jgi:hypothetical protein
MPTVDELLNASNEVTTCTINPDTREIIVPEKYKILGVFSDEKVTKIPFTCPRVVGNNVDLTEYNLYINYQNASGASNAYLIDDLVVSGDNITFSWLLSRYVTFSQGVVKYSFCAKKLDGDTISNEWNTTIATGLVIQGLEATREIIEENPDIIESLISKAHTHENKSVLDKFSETDGKPTYNGIAIGSGGTGGASTAEDVNYTNTQLPNVDNVKGALDELIPKSHTHDNKWVLDKFDEFFGKPIYDGKVLGEGVFIIKATASMNDDGTYEVINPTSTLAEIEAAVEDGKVPIALVEISRTSTVILQLKSCGEGTCIFSTMLYGTEAQLHVVQEDQERWYFIMSSQPISAENVTYYDKSVEGALDELVPKSHTHANKGTLDKLSDSNGKLQYNGSDVGLKGDKGDPGSDANVTKDNVITALGYTPEAVSAQVSTGSNVTLADNTEYRLTDVTTLTLTYPTGNFECWMRLTFAASGNITVTLPTGTEYLGPTPNFKNGETWELSFKDKVLVAQKVGDSGAISAPVKGVDYWTEQDKQEIVNDVIAALPDGTEVSY